MNILKGQITDIKTRDTLSLIYVNVSGIPFSSIVIDNPDSNPPLNVHQSVNVLFKETEVMIAREPLPAISIQNRVNCRIDNIHTGHLLCELTLHVRDGADPGKIKSIITKNACDQLNLRVNDEVVALIRTNEVSLLSNH